MSQSGNAGEIYVSNIRSGAVLSAGEVMYVLSGGKAVETTLNSGGAVVLSQGGCAAYSVINSSGALHVYSGASASNTRVNRSGYLGVGDGAAIYDTTIDYAGELTVWSGGSTIGNTINTWGAIILSSGARAESSVINSLGGLHVYSGATASKTTVNRSGFLGVGNGATIYDTTIDYAGELTVWGGGAAMGNTINTWGAIILSSGALADETVINADGGLHVYSGATASRTTVNQGGFFGVGLGAAAYDTVINYAGALTVWGGGLVSNNTIRKYGAIILSSGALADETVINADGGLHIYNGAAASNTTVKYDASLGVGSGGRLCNAGIDYGAGVTLYSGAIVEGVLDLKGSAEILGELVFTDAALNFNIAEISRSEGVLVNSLSLCNEAALSIEVGESVQNRGRYALAGAAGGFGQSISLFAGSVNKGNLTTDNVIKVGNISYSLCVEENILYLEVDYVHKSNDVRLQVKSGGSWKVKKSGTSMSSVTVSSGQILDADRGGSLANTTIKGGAVRVRDGALAINTVLSSGEMTADCGFAETVSLKNGYLTVTNGGIIRDVTLNGGAVIARNKGIACDNTVNAGSVEACSSAVLLRTVLKNEASLRTYAGGSAVDAVVSSGAAAYIQSDGGLQKVEICSGGTLAVYSGGQCENASVQQGGYVYISAGASVSDLVFTGENILFQLGISDETNVQFVSGGKSYEVSEGKLTGISAGANTYIEVYEGGVVSRLYTTGYVAPLGGGAGGAMQLHSGGSAFDVENHASGQINVFSGGYLSGGFTDNEGEIYLYGGYAQNLEAGSSGYIWIHSGGIGSDIRILGNGGLTISSGGRARNVLIQGGHAIVEEPNAYVSDVVIKEDGVLEVCGASACNVVISSGGIMTFSEEFKQMDGGWLDSPNGRGYDIIVSQGGILAVRRTAAASGVTLHSGSELQVWSGAAVSDLAAGSGTFAVVSGGGNLDGAYIESGATLNIQAGADVTGLNIANGANVILDYRSGMVINGSCNGRAFAVDSDNVLRNYTAFGRLNFRSGTRGEALIIDDCYAEILSGAEVNGVDILTEGVVVVYGSIQNLVTNGHAYIYSGADAGNITIESGYTTINAGASVSGLTLSNGGAIVNGGNITDMTLDGPAQAQIGGAAFVRNLLLYGEECGVTVFAGATLTGRIDLSNGAVGAANGSGIHVIFDLTEDAALSLTTPLVTGFEYVQHADLEVTLTGDQGTGIYKLASFSNGGSFTETSVELIIDGYSAGTLDYGEVLTYNDRDYTLYQGSSDDLLLGIGSGQGFGEGELWSAGTACGFEEKLFVQSEDELKAGILLPAVG